MSFHFLVVDDNPIDRLVSSRMLAHAFEATADTVSGAQEALDYLRDNKANTETIVLLDIKMPEMDGFQFLEHFEFFKETIKANTKIFLLSSTLDRHDLERAKKHQLVIELLGKPLNTDELKSKLNLVVG